MKILVSDNQEHYSKIVKDSEITNNIREADLIIFTGGADVDPELYGENTGKFTRVNAGRDKIEIMTYKLAQELHIPCLGCCRGSQFLTVMNKGKLIQHVDSHGIYGKHLIKTLEGDLSITSTHHQMMYPYVLSDKDYTVVGWMEEALSTKYLNGNDRDCEMLFPEPEIVKYNKTNCLCIQGHPEMMLDDKINISKIRNIIDKYLLNK